MYDEYPTWIAQIRDTSAASEKSVIADGLMLESSCIYFPFIYSWSALLRVWQSHMCNTLILQQIICLIRSSKGNVHLRWREEEQFKLNQDEATSTARPIIKWEWKEGLYKSLSLSFSRCVCKIRTATQLENFTVRTSVWRFLDIC